MIHQMTTTAALSRTPSHQRRRRSLSARRASPWPTHASRPGSVPRRSSRLRLSKAGCRPTRSARSGPHGPRPQAQGDGVLACPGVQPANADTCPLPRGSTFTTWTTPRPGGSRRRWWRGRCSRVCGCWSWSACGRTDRSGPDPLVVCAVRSRPGRGDRSTDANSPPECHRLAGSDQGLPSPVQKAPGLMPAERPQPI